MRQREEKSSTRWTLQQAADSLHYSKLFLSKPNRWLAEDLLGLPGRSLRLYTAAVSGHCALNRHLINLRHKSKPSCRKCELEEDHTTTSHVDVKTLRGWYNGMKILAARAVRVPPPKKKKKKKKKKTEEHLMSKIAELPDLNQKIQQS